MRNKSSVSIQFEKEAHLIWFSMISGAVEPDSFEKTYESGCYHEFDRIIHVPYTPLNEGDFTAEYRLEDKGYYARYYDSKDSQIIYFTSEEAEPALDSGTSHVIVKDMNNMTNLAVADLSVALPGELAGYEADLASDAEFQEWADCRKVEALDFQMMAQENDLLPF